MSSRTRIRHSEGDSIAAYCCRDDELCLPRKEVDPANPACPICGKKMKYYTGKYPSSDWRERVTGVPQLTPEGDDTAQVMVNNATETVHVSDKQLRVLGYTWPMSGDIVKLNGKYYELEGIDKRINLWWITPFDEEKFIEDTIHTLPTFEGPSSDDIVAYLDDDQQVYFNPNSGEHYRFQS